MNACSPVIQLCPIKKNHAFVQVQPRGYGYLHFRAAVARIDEFN